jgi:recombinational DNA repair protein RecT
MEKQQEELELQPQAQPQLATTVAPKRNVGDIVIARINELCQQGMTLPQGYNHVNAIKASLIKLSETKNKEGKPFTEVCTQASIQTALLTMVQKGLDVSRNQGYFCVRGNQLLFQDQYQGIVKQITELYPKYTPNPQVIYDGDVIEIGYDTNTGRRKLISHETKIENIDKDFVGAYIYTPCNDGGQDLYVMTKKQIVTAWMKSNNKSLSVHKEFTTQMARKTIINSALKSIIDSNSKDVPYVYEENNAPQQVEEIETVEV